MALRLLGERPSICTRGVWTSSSAPRKRDRAERGGDEADLLAVLGHVEHLLIDEEKMSKSLGNVFNCPTWSSRASARPRSVSLHLDALPQAAEVLVGEPAAGRGGRAAADDFLARLESIRGGVAHEATSPGGCGPDDFGAMLEQDLNTAGALGVLFDLVRALNTAIDAGEVGEPDAAVIREGLRRRRPRARRAGAPASRRRGGRQSLPTKWSG